MGSKGDMKAEGYARHTFLGVAAIATCIWCAGCMAAFKPSVLEAVSARGAWKEHWDQKLGPHSGYILGRRGDVEVVQGDKTERIAKGQLLVGFDENTIKAIPVSYKSGLPPNTAELNPAMPESMMMEFRGWYRPLPDGYFLVYAPAGEFDLKGLVLYFWDDKSTALLAMHRIILPFKDRARFKVEKGSVTYVGTINVRVTVDPARKVSLGAFKKGEAFPKEDEKNKGLYDSSAVTLVPGIRAEAAGITDEKGAAIGELKKAFPGDPLSTAPVINAAAQSAGHVQ